MKEHTITEARMVRYDRVMDTREYIAGPETEEGLAELQHSLETGEARLEPGLVGWPPFTHTLFSEAWGIFHVALEEA